MANIFAWVFLLFLLLPSVHLFHEGKELLNLELQLLFLLLNNFIRLTSRFPFDFLLHTPARLQRTPWHASSSQSRRVLPSSSSILLDCFLIEGVLLFSLW